MNAFFSFFRPQPGIEPGHPRTLYPDDVVRKTIGHVGSTIYVVNEVLFIYHSPLILLIYAIYIYILYAYKIYTIYITYKIYNTYIRCMLLFFFLFSGPNLLLNQGILVPCIQTLSSVTPSVTWVTLYVVNEVLFIYHSLLTLHIYAIYIYILYAYKIYTIYITYKIYNTYIISMLFFFFRDPP